jgi:predicted ATP-binding protein involved in virulence
MNETLYLKEVKLSGYKSIEDVEIEFQKGINIIIGKNAAGKTNFLSFLNKCISLDFQDLNDFNSLLSFQNGKSMTIETNKNIELEDLLENPNLNSKIDSVLKIEKKEVRDKNSTLKQKLVKKEIFFDSSFLCHGVPNDYLVINQPANWKFEKKKISSDLSKIFRDTNKPYFLRRFVLDLILSTTEIDELNEKSIKNILFENFKKFSKLNEVLAKYSPIEDFRVSDNFNVFIDESKDLFSLNNLFIEFKIDGQWLPFSNLSDGTKRLFYIISEIFDDYKSSNIGPTSSGFFVNTNKISRIILLEEPELGIHPHQFHLLLEFLKVESESKQIIVTTHSPQALDSISENELHRIILAYTSSLNEGTKLRHLNESELLKAKEYIKDDFLSDYWLYSDLEK